MKQILSYKHKEKNVSPAKVFVSGFLILILMGTILLMLPISSKNGEFTGLLTALFTATSASCVTGLVLVDTYTYWSGFGQSIILIMIQIGGLGFMTIATLFSLFIGRTITLRERLVMTTSLNIDSMAGVVKLTKKVLLGTVFFEGIGAIILSIRFARDFGIVEGIKKGIFHSVSAFCNAGFDLLGVNGEFSSLTSYAKDPVVNITIMLLVILGGIGFFVWRDLTSKRTKMELHTKIVLITTAALLLLGFLTFFIFEFNNPATMGGMNIWEKMMAALFQSTTLRTAGFNTIDQGALTPPSMFMSMILMLIGGSPGSTAGGIKTVTVAVLILTCISVLRGKSNVVLFMRKINNRCIMNAVTMFVFGMVFVAFGTFILAINNGAIEAAFEAISAFATVGLTTGITADLDVFSKIILIFLMFFGRVGLITLGLAVLIRRDVEPKLKYPESRIMIG